MKIKSIESVIIISLFHTPSHIRTHTLTFLKKIIIFLNQTLSFTRFSFAKNFANIYIFCCCCFFLEILKIKSQNNLEFAVGAFVFFFRFLFNRNVRRMQIN